MNKNRIKLLLLAVLLIAVIIVARVMPHFANFAPVAAAALFAGYVFRSKLLAFSVPLAGMLISDYFFKGFYDYKVLLFVYMGLSIPVFMAPLLKKQLAIKFLPEKIAKVVAYITKLTMGAVTASALFFVISNFAVWLFSGMYMLNFAGLMKCYTLAIPFFQYTLIGDLVFAGVFFGLFELFRAIQGYKYASMLRTA